MSDYSDMTPRDWRRFDAQLEWSGDCLLWVGEKNGHGYGRLSMWRGGGRRRYLAHRLAHFRATGELPRVVRHACDTPACCNPSHLSGGTQTDNMRDALSRGRLNLAGLALGRGRKERAA